MLSQCIGATPERRQQWGITLETEPRPQGCGQVWQ